MLALLGVVACYSGSGRESECDAPPWVDLADGSAGPSLLARVCGTVPEEPLCRDPAQSAAFIELFNTARAVLPIPLFADAAEFVDFIEGRSEIYMALRSLLGPENPLLAWTPVEIPEHAKEELLLCLTLRASVA